MLEKIKKLQGICNNEFDDIIKDYINSCKYDLLAVGISKKKIDEEDDLIKTAIICYVLSKIDVNNSEMYSNSYNLQKDMIRRLGEYQEQK